LECGNEHLLKEKKMNDQNTILEEAAMDSALFAQKADDLLKKNRVNEALALCESGIKKFPLYAHGHYITAKCYEALGKEADAKDEYERTLYLSPGFPDAMKRLANILADRNLIQDRDNMCLQLGLYNPFDAKNNEFLLKENLISKVSTSPPKEDDSEIEQPALKEETQIKEENAILPEANEDRLASFKMEAKLDETNLETQQTISANTEDDFLTLMKDMFSEVDEAKSENSVEEPNSSSVENALESQVEERPLLDTSLIFLDHKEKEADQASNEKRTENSIQKSVDQFEQSVEEAKRSPAVDDFIESLEPSNNNLAINDELSDVIHQIEALNKQEMGLPFESLPKESAPVRRKKTPMKKKKPIKTEPLDDVDDENMNIEDITSNPNLLTPTFGEILIAQKKFSDALKVFESLRAREPENGRYGKKIEFLQKLAAMDA
jgi:tetratricopeptide (TPR) repeat protein